LLVGTKRGGVWNLLGRRRFEGPNVAERKVAVEDMSNAPKRTSTSGQRILQSPGHLHAIFLETAVQEHFDGDEPEFPLDATDQGRGA
jgi:hypothetical protein